jgi:hypothetical protein
MAISNIRSNPISSTPATENLASATQAPSSEAPKAQEVSEKSFANKTVSLIGKGIKTGLSIAIKGSLKIAQLTAIAALKVGKALVNAIRSASENRQTSTHLQIKPKALQARTLTTIKEVREAQKNLADAIRNGKETIAKQKAAQKERREIAELERRAKALKQEPIAKTKQGNQDYTNFEKSNSTLSANANLSAKDKKDIAELEKRLSDLKKS